VAFYVVVHHRRDKNQSWVNDWADDQRLNAITTTAEIASRCGVAKSSGERIYVHRCAYEGFPARIACSVAVKEARSDPAVSWVAFHDAAILDAPPPVQPARGQNSYEAPPPDSSGA